MSILRVFKILTRSYLLPNTKTYSEYSKKGLIKNNARYCYSVWMRHMVIANKNGLNIKPKYVAEIGPGDSLGMALCSLITGVDEYTIFDSQENINKEINYQVFEDLIKLFKNMDNIPDHKEFPKISPKLGDYSFPSDMFNKSYLSEMLNKKRLNQIKKSIDNFNSKDSQIKYVFNFDKNINEKFDLIISHAVLEHIDKIDDFFKFMENSLRLGGFVSHQVDLKSHDTASSWDGHWRYSNFFWKILRGKRLWFINRLPFSKYIKLFKEYHFKNILVDKNIMQSSYKRSKLAKEFKFISEEDRQTSGFFIQAIKEINIIF